MFIGLGTCSIKIIPAGWKIGHKVAIWVFLKYKMSPPIYANTCMICQANHVPVQVLTRMD